MSCWFRPQKAAPNDRQHERLLPVSSRHDPGERGCHVLSRHRASVPNQNLRPAPGLRPSRGQVYQHHSQEIFRVDRQSPSNNSNIESSIRTFIKALKIFILFITNLSIFGFFRFSEFILNFDFIYFFCIFNCVQNLKNKQSYWRSTLKNDDPSIV